MFPGFCVVQRSEGSTRDKESIVEVRILSCFSGMVDIEVCICAGKMDLTKRNFGVRVEVHQDSDKGWDIKPHLVLFLQQYLSLR